MVNLPRLNIADAFPVIVFTGRRSSNGRVFDYHSHLQELRGYKASGVYAIIDTKTRRVFYVGESHTGRLYDTITRHFREWRVDPSKDAQGRRRGGTTYDRRTVRVIYLLTNDQDAQALQYAEIQRLNPRDNTINGSSVVVDALPI